MKDVMSKNLCQDRLFVNSEEFIFLPGYRLERERNGERARGGEIERDTEGERETGGGERERNSERRRVRYIQRKGEKVIVSDIQGREGDESDR